MKISEIVHQLRTVMPKYTSALSTNVGVSSVSASGGTVTVTTSAAHGLSVGSAVTMSGFLFNNAITAVSTDGLVHTFTTQSDHDLTEGWQDTVTLTGFTNAAFNAEHTLVSVPNRKNFSITLAEASPALNGNEILLETRDYVVNGQFQVATVPDTTHFTFTNSDIFDGDYTDGTLSTTVQIYGVIDVDRAIEQYTAQPTSQIVMFVSPADAEVSKDRSVLSDATATPTSGSSLRLRLIDGFMVFVVINTTQDIGAVDALDLARHDLLSPLLKSLYGVKFSSGLQEDSDFKTVFLGHGIALYNTAILAYRYDFEMSSDLTDNDAVDPSLTRAFRDINYAQNMSTGTEALETIIDLDDVREEDMYSEYAFYDAGGSLFSFSDVSQFSFDNIYTY